MVDERVVLMADRPTTIGMFGPESFVPEPPPLIVGLRRPVNLAPPDGDFSGERLPVEATFAF